MTDVERETLRMLVLLAECELEAENARLKQELADYIGMRDPDLDLDTKGRFLAAKRRRSGHEGLNRARADEGQKAQDAYNNQAQARVQTVGLVAPSYSEAAQTEDEVPSNLLSRVMHLETEWSTARVPNANARLIEVERRLDQLSSNLASRAER